MNTFSLMAGYGFGAFLLGFGFGTVLRVLRRIFSAVFSES
jgi:hypothetical protein